MRQTFDHVISGGGSAGSVLAHRLVFAGRSVLLLEAGTAYGEVLACCRFRRHLVEAPEESGGSVGSALLARRLQRELDGQVANRPSIDLFARRLRDSTSTVPRTCRALQGHTAKELENWRVALKAQCLLVHAQARSRPQVTPSRLSR